MQVNSFFEMRNMIISCLLILSSTLGLKKTLYIIHIDTFFHKMSSIKSFLFVSEVFHVVSHILVMTGYRTLPRKILSKQKYYFLFDLLTSLASLIIHGRFWPIIVLQNIQHAFYFLTWPEGR